MTIEEINQYINSTLVGQKVNSNRYGECTIVSAHAEPKTYASARTAIAEVCLNASLEHSNGTVGYYLDRAISTGTVTFIDEAGVEAYNTVMFDLETLLTDLQKEAEAEQERLKAEQEAKLAEEQKKLEEIKYEENKARVLKKLATAKAEPFGKDFPVNQYEVLGWMAKHCVSVRAALPDYAESWFVAHFGDVARNVVDSHKKTSGGFAYQWGLGFRITFNEVVPDVLASKASPTNKKVIDNVAFVWDLVDNYGFQFGKKQNIDEILKYLSGKALDDFKRGYEM